VHNGIEYALMTAYAEGYEVLAAEELIKDPQAVYQAWTNGTVVRSWLQQLLAKALKEDPGLEEISGYTEDSGEGRWTVEEAVRLGVPAPAITAALFKRFRSQEKDNYGDRLAAALRGAGGEAVVAGTVFGKRDLRVVRVNQFQLEAVPEGDIILCENDDAPGVVGRIGTALGQAGVNIARISLSRDAERRAAFSLINVDSTPGVDVLEGLRRLEHVRAVRSIKL
jgi:hypothetical protein